MFTEKEIRQNVGNIVKQLRMQKGLTQEKLAEFIDVQPQTIRSIEKGRSCERNVCVDEYSIF